MVYLVGNGGLNNGGGRENKKGFCVGGITGPMLLLLGLRGGYRLRNHGKWGFNLRALS